jgi:NarL family two-component system response regulator LiaR
VILIDEDLAPAALRGMLVSAPRAPIVVLSPRPTEDGGIGVLAGGASGYLDKGLDPELFARLVRGVARGEAAISRTLTRRILDELPPTGGGMSGLRPIRSGLSSRDWELIDLLRLRAPPGELARELGLSPLALRRRLRALQARLGVASPEEVVESARRQCLEAVRGVPAAGKDDQQEPAGEVPPGSTEPLRQRHASSSS